MAKFYDTNAILELQDKIFNDDFVYISSITLTELEGIKQNRNKTDDVRSKARKATRLLCDNTDKYMVVFYDDQIKPILQTLGLPETPDYIICACARYTGDTIPDLVFVTYDIACRVIAKKIFKLNTEFVEIKEDAYTGFSEQILSDEKLAFFYENQTLNMFNLLPNQYLIIKNQENNIVDRLKWTGNTHQPLKIGNIKSKLFGVLKAYNGDVYQQCVLDSICSNTITMIKGVAGTGKSYLALGYLFHLLEKEEIQKIVVFTNTQPTANAARLGFYPGTRTEKLMESSIGNILASKLGDSYIVEKLIVENRLLLLPMCDVRGFDTTGMNCGVYITEAQNMDISLMKLALQRIGEDSICIVEGDYTTQVDLPSYSGSNNGMRRMSEVFRGQDFYGEVELQNIYRSRIASVAEFM